MLWFTLSFRLSVRLSSVCPSVCLSVGLSVRPSVCPSDSYPLYDFHNIDRKHFIFGIEIALTRMCVSNNINKCISRICNYTPV